MRRPVGPDQPGQLRPALLHDGEADRVGLDRLDVGGQLGRNVGEQVCGLADPARQRAEPGVVLRRRLQRRPRRGQQAGHVHRVVATAGRVAEQRLMRRRGGGVQRVGVRQPLFLRHELDVLALGRLGALDLGHAVAQVVGLARALTRHRGQLVELGPDLLRAGGRRAGRRPAARRTPAR